MQLQEDEAQTNRIGPDPQQSVRNFFLPQISSEKQGLQWAILMKTQEIITTQTASNSNQLQGQNVQSENVNTRSTGGHKCGNNEDQRQLF